MFRLGLSSSKKRVRKAVGKHLPGGIFGKKYLAVACEVARELNVGVTAFDGHLPGGAVRVHKRSSM
jgi:hypothetical protein